MTEIATLAGGPVPDTSLATLAGGCFWCTEAIFQRVNGVVKVTPGYAGGDPKKADYDHVVMGNTGHAESIQIEFDPSIISFNTLLDVFFATHDPTTLNAQGNDVGTQYRSVIFYHDTTQKEIAENKMKPGYVTEIVPYTQFFPTENYHTNYYDKNRESNSYCSVIIDPKIKKLLTKFSGQVKKEYLQP